MGARTCGSINSVFPLSARAVWRAFALTGATVAGMIFSFVLAMKEGVYIIQFPIFKNALVVISKHKRNKFRYIIKDWCMEQNEFFAWFYCSPSIMCPGCKDIQRYTVLFAWGRHLAKIGTLLEYTVADLPRGFPITCEVMCCSEETKESLEVFCKSIIDIDYRRSNLCTKDCGKHCFRPE